jgi:hypothetical protein
MTDPASGERWLMPAFTTEVPLPDRPFRTWPFFVQGSWELRDDWRGVVLYRRDTGEPAEIWAAGITLEQAGLTLDARPDGEHKWDDAANGWILDPEAVALRERKQVQARLDAEFMRVRERLHGRADAFVAGLLSPLDVGLYKAWAAYAVQLSEVQSSPDFPNVTEWPVAPVDDEVAAQVAKELEEAAQRAADEAAAKVEMETARLPWRGGDPSMRPTDQSADPQE